MIPLHLSRGVYKTYKGEYMKKDTKLKISFIGGNAYDVTGSATLIEWNDRHILLDCGLIQGGTTLQDYKDNRNMLTKNKFKKIDTVIIGERHADHSCNIPYITKVSPECRVITPLHTKEIFKCMFEDSAKIAERDCELLHKKYEDRIFIPNYNLSDVGNCLDRIEEYPVGERIQIDDDIRVKFSYSGHIFGCCQTELWINVNGKEKHLLYTADLGNILNQENRPFTEELQRVESATLVISESTYGAKQKKQCTKKTITKDLEKMYSVIEQYTIDLKSRVLIPTFSLDRTPAMLYMIWKKFKNNPRFKDVKVLVDSPLANRLLDVYLKELPKEKQELLAEILSWNNIIRITTPEESKYAMENYKSCVIVASSGMCNIGRSKMWLMKMLPNAEDCVLFSGYCGTNTLGYKIKNHKQKYITIDGKAYPNRCNIVSILGQSSHIQRNELIDYLSSINSQKICLVHGEMNGRIELAEDLKEALANKSKTTSVCVVNKDTRISL